MTATMEVRSEAAPFPMLNPRIVELGKIKIGGKSAQERASRSGGTWRAPVKFDHFVVTTMQRGDGGDLVPDAELLAELARDGYADPDGQVRRLPIQLLSNEIEDVLSVTYLRYRGKKIEAKSDGVTVIRYLDKRNGEPLPAPEVTDWKPEYADAKDAKGVPLFKLHSTLSCVIASRKARWGGVYKFRTTSRISADQLLSTLTALRSLCNGVLMGLPLNLVVTPRTVNPNGQTSTVYVVHVELRGGDMQSVMAKAQEVARFQLDNREQITRTQAEYRRLLQAPESIEETEAAAGEFHPEEAARDVAPAKPGADPLFENPEPETSDPQPDLTGGPSDVEAATVAGNLPPASEVTGSPPPAGNEGPESEVPGSASAKAEPETRDQELETVALKARSKLRDLLTLARQGGLKAARERCAEALALGGVTEALCLDLPKAYEDAGLSDEWSPESGASKECVRLLERLNEQAKVKDI